MRSVTENPIRVNHVGFAPGAKKTFVMTEPETPRFTVELMSSTEFVKVFEGELQRFEGLDGTGFVGDFSSVRSEGDYVIRCGSTRSRFFVIKKNAYDNALRTMLQYFTYQRCGSDLGWAGRCHLDDGRIAETGGHVDLSGGYHQSCDLRKSPGGISIGVLGLIRAALVYTPVWKRLLDDEIAWACDYYVKTIQDDGRMYNTLSEPFGWEGRTFYQAAAPASAEWNVVSILALGSKYFGDKEKYLPAAIRAWDYMTSDRRPAGAYRHPVEKLPRGMDAANFYAAIYKGSAADLAYRVSAARDLFEATGDGRFLEGVETLEKTLTSLCDPLPRVAADSEQLLLNKCNYAWCPASPVANEGLRELLLDFSNKSLWGGLPRLYCEADLDDVIGHPAPGRVLPSVRQQLGNNIHPFELGGKSFYYSYGSPVGSTPTWRLGFYLAEGGAKYRPAAQRIIDTMLGANSLDSSAVEAVGYNHVLSRPFGQFFPSTPQIPGATGVGCSSIDHTSASSEYDMPAVGMAMLLAAELSN